ncbi:MAG: hypothetical protein IIZ59_02515 [Clostridia bacterium]|nr:hypothetical protein [Clostridia bacterium]
MDNHNRKNDIDRLARQAGAALGTSGEQIREAAERNDIERLLSKLTPAQAQKVKSVLSNEDAIRQLLSSPQAKAILGGGNEK